MSPAEQSLLIAADAWVRRMTDDTQVLRVAYADNVLLMCYPSGTVITASLIQDELSVFDLHVQLPATRADLEDLPRRVLVASRLRKLALLS